MAYKNSDGNSSIANQWGQWRYFNSALDKLGTAKPATVTINENNVTIPEADNWMDSVTAVFKGIQGGIEAKKELSYKLADDYLKNHSLEEYRDQMVKGLVPFQDDPLAMSRLKESHGQMVFQYITDDFQRRVDSNEFKGMSSEQVDAEFFKYARQQSADIAKTFGYSENDVFFNRGLFTNSPTERIKMMARQKEVEHNFNVQDMFITESAKIHAIIQNGGNVEALVGALKGMDLTVGRHFDPEHRNKFWASVVRSLENSPEGFFNLQQLADRKDLPFSNGITLREYLGEDGYKTSLIKAYNYRYALDAQSKLDFQNGLDVMANNGKAAELLVLRNSKLEESGGLFTDEVKDIEKAYDSAVRVQISNAKKNAIELKKQQDELLKTSASRSFIQAVARGEPVVAKDVVGITNKDIDTAYQYLVDTGSITFKDQLAIAKNPHLPFSDNSARKHFANQATDAINWLNNSTKEFMTSKVFPKKIKDSVNTLIEVYKADPSNFSNIIGSSSDKNLEDARALAIMLSSGRPIEDIIRGKAEIQKLKDEGNTKEITKIRDKAIKAVQDPMLGDSKDIDYNGKVFVTTLTFAFRSMGETDRNAVALATAEYNKSFKNLMGTSVPSSFFTGRSGLTVPDKELLARIKKKIPSKYLEDSDKNATLSFDTSSNVLTVADRAGNAIFSINQTEASNLVDSIGDEIYKEVERQDILKEKYTGLAFGDDKQYNDR